MTTTTITATITENRHGGNERPNHLAGSLYVWIRWAINN
jgi:hypothetical protein